MGDFKRSSLSLLQVGLVGTGYAAKLRAEALNQNPRSRLVGVAGHDATRTQDFSHTHETKAFSTWKELVEQDLDLIVIATQNRDHAAIAQAALQAGKHVVVEYPLALNVADAEALVTLARAQGKLLHVEHIELLGGVHQAARRTLLQIGTPFYARYSTIKAQHPAPNKWTYDLTAFGFPLMGALSRIHRLTHLLGPVATVSCQSRYWGLPAPSDLTADAPSDSVPQPFTACLCSAQLRFTSGVLAEVIYGKGDTLWESGRRLDIQGSAGGMVFDGEQGRLIQGETVSEIEVKGRRGLFAKDTDFVLGYLMNGTPLYVTPAESVYALQVADAARRSAATGQVVEL